ncbi:MAG: toll/interleukin-1 receptor domain-containing protein [Actinobacteria bacterium]|nr:toll/interleukin-1 receptor domain-containing protein [Actinomycetota bacterium]
MGEPLKVFCSYRGVRVEAFAGRLRNDGIDAWLDVWEIVSGDDVVDRMDVGIDGCDAGLLFISKDWFDGAWAQDEQTSLRWRRVEHGIRVIPVIIGEISGDQLSAGRAPVESYDGCSRHLGATSRGWVRRRGDR